MVCYTNAPQVLYIYMDLKTVERGITGTAIMEKMVIVLNGNGKLMGFNRINNKVYSSFYLF